jgi:hypothetical protein
MVNAILQKINMKVLKKLLPKESELSHLTSPVKKEK